VPGLPYGLPCGLRCGLALVVGLAALLLGGGLPLQAHPAATVLVCEDPACAICTNLLDDVCIHGVTVQDIRVDVLASNRLRVVHYIAADTALGLGWETRPLRPRTPGV